MTLVPGMGTMGTSLSTDPIDLFSLPCLNFSVVPFFVSDLFLFDLSGSSFLHCRWLEVLLLMSEKQFRVSTFLDILDSDY